MTTILVVDNDEGMTVAMRARLEDLGYCCVTACSGAQGLAMFQACEVDLVLTDVNMPNGDGINLTREVRRLGDTPVILCTGFQDEFREELYKLDAVSVIRKPCETAQLLELIEADLVMSGAEIPERA